MTFRMNTSVCPGDHMVFDATVTGTAVAAAGCGWVALDVALLVGDVAPPTCAVRVALPTHDGDNPWARSGQGWRPGDGDAG